MENQWRCQFKDPPQKITVGQKLILLCEGEPKIEFKKSPRIEFLNQNQKYSLHILRVLNQEDYFLALEVTSYRTGEFKSPFVITDGEHSLLINDFSFSVQSVLRSETKQARGPFGPFPPKFPSLALGICTVLSVSGLSLFIFIFLRRFFERKKLIKKIIKRKTYLNPSKSFILSLRKPQIEKNHPIQNLESAFKIFLEDFFVIPATNQNKEQIMKFLKKHHYPVYKKEGQSLRQILNEFSAVDKKTTDRKTFLKLKTACQKIVFSLDKKENNNDLA